MITSVMMIIQGTNILIYFEYLDIIMSLSLVVEVPNIPFLLIGFTAACAVFGKQSSTR